MSWAFCLLLSFGPIRKQGLTQLAGGWPEALRAQTYFWVLNQTPPDTLHLAYFLAALPNQFFPLFVRWQVSLCEFSSNLNKGTSFSVQTLTLSNSQRQMNEQKNDQKKPVGY